MADYKIPGHFETDGIVLGGVVSRESLERACSPDLPLRPDDYVLVSYPKSGSTWLKYAAQLIMKPEILADPPYTGNIHQEVHYLEFNLPFEKVLSAPPPRLLGSHLRYQHLHHQLEKNKIKVIHVRREPKDVITSYYHFYRMNNTLGNFNGNFDKFFELFKAKKLFYGDMIEYDKEWWNARDNKNIMYLTYASIKTNPKKCINEIADFMGVDLTEEAVQKIVHLTEFSNMKANPYTNGEAFGKMGMFDLSICSFVRKGVIGDHKNMLSDEQIEFVNERMKETDVVYGV